MRQSWTELVGDARGWPGAGWQADPRLVLLHDRDHKGTVVALWALVRSIYPHGQNLASTPTQLVPTRSVSPAPHVCVAMTVGQPR